MLVRWGVISSPSGCLRWRSWSWLTNTWNGLILRFAMQDNTQSSRLLGAVPQIVVVRLPLQPHQGLAQSPASNSDMLPRSGCWWCVYPTQLLNLPHILIYTSLHSYIIYYYEIPQQYVVVLLANAFFSGFSTTFIPPSPSHQ